MRARSLRRASTDAERALWNGLRNRELAGCKFRRQHPIDRYFADFACIEAGLVVELDGCQHLEAQAIEADRLRTLALKQAGFSVLRFDDRQVLLERESVLAAIFDWLQTPRSRPGPHPGPLPPAGEGDEKRSDMKED